LSSRWRNELLRFLRERDKGRIILLGVGNVLKGDDAAGSLLARRLRARGAAHVFDAGGAPENYAERVAASAPDAVIVFDAARFGGRAGEARLFTSRDLTAGAVSTHDQSLGALARYLVGRCGCEVRILGIEPASAAMGAEISPEVLATLDELETFLLGCLT